MYATTAMGTILQAHVRSWKGVEPICWYLGTCCNPGRYEVKGYGTKVTMILRSSDMNYMGCGYGTSEEYETGIRCVVQSASG